MWYSFYFLRCDLVKDWRRGNLRTLVREASIFYAALGERSKPSAFQAEDHRFESGTRYHIKGRYSNSPFSGRHSSINYLGIKSAYVILPCFLCLCSSIGKSNRFIPDRLLVQIQSQVPLLHTSRTLHGYFARKGEYLSIVQLVRTTSLVRRICGFESYSEDTGL